MDPLNTLISVNRSGLTGKGVALILVFVLALGVRFGHWSEYAHTALNDWHRWDQTDMAIYLEQARRIAGGDWLAADPYHPYHPNHTWQQVATPETRAKWHGPHVLHQAPAYSYLLALLSLTTSAPTNVMKILQLLVGALSCVLIFLITNRVAGLLAAMVSGVLSALYAPMLYLEAHILREALAIFCLLLIVYLLIRYLDRGEGDRPAGVVAVAGIGIALGSFLMLHQIALVLCVFTLGTVLVFCNQRRHRVGLVHGAALVAGFTVGFSPWMVRNLAVDAPVFSVSSRAAVNLVMANEAKAPNGGVFTSPMSASAARILENADGDRIKLVKGVWAGYEGNVRLLLFNWYQRFRAIWDPRELYDNTSLQFFRDMTYLVNTLPDFRIVFPLGLAGMLLVTLGALRSRFSAANHNTQPGADLSLVSWQKHKAKHSALLLLVLVIIGIMSFSFAVGRHRLYLVVFFLIYAGVAAEMLYQYVHGRCWAQALLVVALAGVGLGIQNYSTQTRWDGYPPLIHYAVAQELALARGETEAARRTADRAHRLYPGEPVLFSRLAKWFEQHGNDKLASDYQEKALGVVQSNEPRGELSE